MVANTEEPNSDPDSELFATYADVDATPHPDSTIRTATWIVESNAEGGNVLDRRSLGEWFVASESIRRDADHSKILADRYDADTGVTIPGLISIADIVDSFAPSGIEAASEDEVRAAVTQVLSRVRSPYRTHGHRHQRVVVAAVLHSNEMRQDSIGQCRIDPKSHPPLLLLRLPSSIRSLGPLGDVTDRGRSTWLPGWPRRSQMGIT